MASLIKRILFFKRDIRAGLSQLRKTPREKYLGNYRFHEFRPQAEKTRMSKQF